MRAERDSDSIVLSAYVLRAWIAARLSSLSQSSLTVIQNRRGRSAAAEEAPARGESGEDNREPQPFASKLLMSHHPTAGLTPLVHRKRRATSSAHTAETIQVAASVLAFLSLSGTVRRLPFLSWTVSRSTVSRNSYSCLTRFSIMTMNMSQCEIFNAGWELVY